MGKAGSGKTFCALNTVVELNQRGYRTALIDGEQGAWPAAKRLLLFDSSLEALTVSSLPELQEGIESLTSKGFHVVVDWAGEMSQQVGVLCSICDLFIVPMETAETDLIQTANTLTLIRANQLQRGGKPQAWIVFNKTKKVDGVAGGFREQVQVFGLPIANTQLRKLDTYRDNRCVMRDKALNKNREASDFRAFLDETVMPYLEKTEQVANG